MFDKKTIAITEGRRGSAKNLRTGWRARREYRSHSAGRKQAAAVQSELKPLLKEGRKAEIFSCDVRDAVAVEKTMKAHRRLDGRAGHTNPSCGGRAGAKAVSKNSVDRDVPGSYGHKFLRHAAQRQSGAPPFFKQKGGGRIVIRQLDGGADGRVRATHPIARPNMRCPALAARFRDWN